MKAVSGRVKAGSIFFKTLLLMVVIKKKGDCDGFLMRRRREEGGRGGGGGPSFWQSRSEAERPESYFRHGRILL